MLLESRPKVTEIAGGQGGVGGRPANERANVFLVKRLSKARFAGPFSSQPS